MKRYFQAGTYLQKIQLGSALRQALNSYNISQFKSDLFAGFVVSVVAIPLAMALGVASGVAPQNGLYTIVIGGFLIAVLGGSKFQVSGPTAAFVALLAPIASAHGLEGLLLSGFLAGIILVLMSLLRFGRFISIIPYPVTTGFTLGVGIVIALIQLKDFFGLSLPHAPISFFERIELYATYFSGIQWQETAVGVVTLLILIVWPKINKSIPSPIVALSIVGTLVYTLNYLLNVTSISTIYSQFQYQLPDGRVGMGIPTVLPKFDFSFISDIEILFVKIPELLPSAFAIALLGAIESLLSAVVADSLTGEKHNSDTELMALGIGNILCPFFGGIAATGAIARTSTNIKYGGKSPISSAIHAIIVLLVILSFAKVISYLPMASLAALLLFVAYHMMDIKHVKHLIRVAPGSDVIVLVTCAAFTAIYDMVIGIGVGMVLASFLFMQRMAQLTEGRVLTHEREGLAMGRDDNQKSLVFEIRGPLFFGAAERAMKSLEIIGSDIVEVTFDFTQVPTMDMTGLVAFESTVGKLQNKGILVRLASLSDEVKGVLERSSLLKELM